MKTVLIIDDEEKLRGLLARIIGLESMEVLQAGDARTAWKKLERQPVDVVLCDVKLPDANGVELAARIKEKYPLLEIILLTAYGNIPDGVQAIKNGAFDYITKGDDNHRIIPLLHSALARVESRHFSQKAAGSSGESPFASILGESPAIREAISLARKVAASDATVLLTGETGSGKEVFAQAIHRASARAAHPFIAINCAAFGKELLESEMFGYKAGAFTGALKDKAGLFEAAHKGTLFLDEIGEMSPELQAKLLRVLESGEFTRIGETKASRVDVRILSATHRDLQEEVGKGHFRQDLFYRIGVFQIHLPALRERLGDISLLADYFLRYFSQKYGKKTLRMSDAFLALLQLHHWPGNIRELKNIIERSVILSEGEELQIDTLPGEWQSLAASGKSAKVFSAFELASAEKIHIRKVLQFTGGNKTETARLLNIALTTLYRKLEEYSIS